MASPVAACQVVAAHAVLGFEMADDGLDGGAAAQLALDLVGHAPFLSASKTQQPAPQPNNRVLSRLDCTTWISGSTSSRALLNSNSVSLSGGFLRAGSSL